MKITIGDVDGDSWEKLIHKVHGIKYPDTYVKVPAKFKGDLGIEGYTFEGHAFQCYCPNHHPNSTELYIAQRDKITKDINKLIDNELELIKLLGSTKIETWVFVTPRYENKDLIKHCRKKESEVIARSCSHINNKDFKIIIREEDSYASEIGLLIRNSSLKYNPPIPKVDSSDIEDWKKDGNSLLNNLDRKLSIVSSKPDSHSIYIHSNIEALLIGEELLHDLENRFPDLFQGIIHLIDVWEKEVQDKSLLANSHIDLLKNTAIEFREDLIREYEGQINVATARYITRYVISFWLCKCPLELN